MTADLSVILPAAFFEMVDLTEERDRLAHRVVKAEEIVMALTADGCDCTDGQACVLHRVLEALTEGVSISHTL